MGVSVVLLVWLLTAEMRLGKGEAVTFVGLVWTQVWEA